MGLEDWLVEIGARLEKRPFRYASEEFGKMSFVVEGRTSEADFV